MEKVLKDERFSHILTDPSFRRIPKKVRKIQIDNRFKALLKNKRFTEKCSIDEHGCALKLDATENLRKLYNMDEDSSESEDISDKDKLDKMKKLIDVSKSKERGEKKLKGEKKKLKDKSLNDNIGDLDDENSLNEFNDQNKISKKKKDKNQKTKKDLKCKSNQLSASEYEGKNELSLNDTNKGLHKNSSTNKNELSNLNNNFCVTKNLGNKHQIKHQFDLRCKQTDSEVDSSEEEESDKDSEKQNESESADSSEEDSDEDSESDDSESKEGDSFDHQWEEQHERAPDTNEITKRLAVCHMDWDRIRAVDLFAVFNSFKPPDTSIVSAKIYPSEYGLQRMKEEKLNGPRELVEKTLAVDEEEDKKGSKYHREKLRQYQMNRLKYYYAIVECDTLETSNTLYEQLNGMEYESSSVRFDLRFVPDDLTFDQEPTSVAENPDLTEYKPKLFVTTALQQVKVGLTWDETDPQRREVLQKAFTEPDNIEKDIQEYLASSSEESEEEIINNEDDNKKLSTKERIQKYKSLLESINEKEKSGEKFEMEITWEPGVKEKTESLVKEKLEEKSYTPFEELQKKKKEKQKLKKKVNRSKTYEPEESKDELSDMSDSDTSTEMKISSIKKKGSKTSDELYLISDAKKVDAESEQSTRRGKKKKTKQETKDDFKVNVNDPRFSAIYTSPLFNIDPSDPHFKSTPGNLAIIAEKQRRLKNGSKEESNKKFKYS